MTGELRRRFEEAGQKQVFRFWDRLDAEGRRRLCGQLERIDLALVDRLRAQFLDGSHEASPARLEPAPVAAPDPSLVAAGEELLAQGKAACLTVAGGQGTRLGFDGPKGCYPVGPISRKTLFELFAEQLRAVERRHGRPVRWLVMTSPENHEQTRAFFERRDWLGLLPEQVTLFPQGMLPALDRDGRLILAAPDRLFLSPDGHGGTVGALARHGLLADLAARGIDQVCYAQVDNPLATLLDPLFLGHHAAAGAEMSTKVVRKRDAAEKVGVLALVDGRPGLVEYSDLSPEQQQATDAPGSLRFWAGNIAMHVFDRAFLERLTSGGVELPYHLAIKQVPLLDDAGLPSGCQPGHKFERFIFDALPLARATLNLEVQREEQFAPLKNAEGADSPAETQRLLVRYWGGMLERAGAAVPRDAAGEPVVPIEISPLYAMDAAELAARLPSDLSFEGPVLLEEGR